MALIDLVGCLIRDDLERLEELFVQIDAARQFLKMVVIERQQARLSRLLIGTGISAVILAAVGIFTYCDIVGLNLPRPTLVVVAGTLIPLAILEAYVLRVATIARQTASYGPFIPESDD